MRKLLLRCGVQISPSAEDLGETLCSLNFASHVKGIEYGPACKQADFSELLKYKYLAKKSKHDEKEAKKLQENVQSLQLRLSAREHICRNLQEKAYTPSNAPYASEEIDVVRDQWAKFFTSKYSLLV
ncbi:kinesin-like protein KIN-14S [Spinacia oleracea]|uniref:Kinesin-like protein KIN-14S n=1 Tax=Spinacia oleracea TaxID=3562 RepID=A0ABM3R4K6_SPIOL|nr:kinesin-like protein KIN-14S [Spinacia oleracea]XP_056690554.1 kinesin-like protein KIN-14S [Spinacia oleracea]